MGSTDLTTAQSTPGSSWAPLSPSQHTPVILKDDFGMAKMMAIIEVAANSRRPPPPAALSPVDELLFGPPLVLADLHPFAREIYGPTLQQLDEMDRVSNLFLFFHSWILMLGSLAAFRFVASIMLYRQLDYFLHLSYAVFL